MRRGKTRTLGIASMDGTDQEQQAPRKGASYVAWFLGVALIAALAMGQYAAALGGAIGFGIVWAGAKGLIPEQGPSRAGNVVAVILVVAIVLVIALAWWVGRGA
jgi:hypothetical protein